MPREIILGNGNMLVALDAALRLRDLYFPQLNIKQCFGMQKQPGFLGTGKFCLA